MLIVSPLPPQKKITLAKILVTFPVNSYIWVFKDNYLCCQLHRINRSQRLLNNSRHLDNLWSNRRDLSTKAYTSVLLVSHIKTGKTKLLLLE